MSTRPSVSKLSNISQVLSEQSVDSSPRIHVGAVYSLSNRDKQVFTDAVHYCMVLLRQSNRFTNHKSDVLSLEATLMGHEMFERIIGINVQMDVETEDEAFAYSGQLSDLVKHEPNTDYSQSLLTYDKNNSQTNIEQETKNQNDEEQDHPWTIKMSGKSAAIEEQKQPARLNRTLCPMVIKIPEETVQDFLRYSEGKFYDFSASNNEDKQLPPSPVSLPGSDYSTDQFWKGKPGPKMGSHFSVIPLELKQKVVSLWRKNPNWSIQQLRKEVELPNLRSNQQVKAWERQIDGGGTKYDKYHKINNLTYERFIAAQRKSQLVNSELIRQWAIQAARDVYGSNFKFKATVHWISNFKKLYSLQWNPVLNAYFQKNDKKVIKAARPIIKKKRTLRSSGRITSDEL